MKRKFSLFVTIVVCLLLVVGILSACNEGEKKIASIDFADGEWQTNYYLGEVFEPCVATVTYEDGSTEEVTVTPEMVKGFDTSKLGNYNIEITINGVTKVMTITVVEKGEEAHVHSMELTAAKEATCTEGGNNAYYHCSGCDKYFKDEAGTQETTVEAETIPATGHNWNNGEITTAATCTTDGVKTYTCLDCGETKIETIPALGHGMTIIKAKDATCTEAGNNAYYHCTRCDKYFKDIEGEEETTVEAETIAAKGHDYEETVVSPSCTEEGYTLYECRNCDDSYTDSEVAALGHSMTLTEANAATCTEEGNNEYYYCSRCDKYFKDIEGEEETTVEAEIIPATGHNWNGGEITTAATCTTDGVMTYTCLDCGETKTETIAAAGHDYEETVIAPTCTENGYTLYECRNCDDSYTDSEVAALGHSMTLTEANAATCTEAGNNAYYHCSRCDKYFKDIEGEEETTVEAETIPATGHNYVNGECVNCGAIEPGYGDEDVYTRVDEDGSESATGDYILFGSYPQSKVTDASIISALGEFDESTWTSYGYFIERQVSDYMYYIDKEYNGEKYRGVYFTSYRPLYCTNSSSASYSYQVDNGYVTSTVYWFKYEPIKWLIVEESDGKATLVADLILDSQQYDYEADKETYGNNNYAESTIRAWLNDTFYNTAFNELQQAIIQTVEVDNSAASTGYNPNQYACENTNDKIFLMSYVEADTWFTSSAERQKQGSDYAKSQGLWVSTSSSYSGNSGYWLRSPLSSNSSNARVVNYDGNIDIHYYYVDHTDFGVLPALVIMLGDSAEHIHTMEIISATEATCTEEGNNEYYYCSECGNYFKDIEGEEETTVEAETIPATGHNWNGGEITTAATCTEDGVMTYTCLDCGETKTETIAAAGHDYEETVIAPTCTEEGYTLYECRNCDDSYTDSEVAALGHYMTLTEAKDATCTEAGNNAYYHCSGCDKYFKDIEGEVETTVEAEIISATGHNYVNGECLNCGAIEPGYGDEDVYTRVDEDGNESATGEYILFGSYPQTKVTDASIISALGGFDENTWTSYGYFIEGQVSDYMYYIDKEYNGEKYRGVYFTSYRPYNCDNSSSASDSWQDDNGYVTSTVYWFKYEPIKWLIVEESDGKATLVADLILDSQQYDYEANKETYGNNNYAESTIRAWLNESFYNTAFNELQQAIIQTVEVDNSVGSTGYDPNQYACENTADKIFLMSYVDATTWFTSNSAREKQGSDYAKSQGLYVSTSSSYSGNSRYWLRSPYNYYSYSARAVYYDGNLDYSYYVYTSNLGVLPALVIMLGEPAEHIHTMEIISATEATCTEEGNNEYYYCSECGNYFKDIEGEEETTVESEIIPATGHNWNGGEITTAATCTTDGVMTYTCLDCGETKTETIAATGHKWDEGEITTATTCTEDGVMTFTCSNCNETRTETIPAGHDFVDGVCSACGEKFYSEGLEYRLSSNKTYYIVTGIGTASGDIIIPDTHEGLPVSYIGSAAFQDCSSLTSIEIPAGVTSIGSYAFDGCSSLTSIEIPAGVKSIGDAAFYHCYNLNTVHYAGSIDNWFNFGYGGAYSNPLSNGADLYIDGELVTEVVVPESVTTIGDYQLIGCTSLSSITIHSGVTSIGERAFYRCSNLESVTFAEGSKLTSIGSSAFYYCSSLTSIEIPSGVTSIRERAFYGCSNLESVTFAEGSQLTSIGNFAFSSCSKLESVTFAEGSQLISIGSSAFNDCSSLTSISIPAGVTSIGDHAFYGCSSQDKVYYSGGIEDWFNIDFSDRYSIPLNNGADLYIGGELVTAVVVPESITAIGYQFIGCTSLTSITIHSGVTSIGSGSFSGCSKLESVTFAEGSQLNSIGSSAFNDCSSLTSIEIPAGVTSIGNYAFFGCSSLTDVSFAEGSQLTSIGDRAFQYCRSLTSIEIPAGVTSIGYGAFNGCSSLESVTFAEGSQLTSIGDRAFYECSSLTSIEIPAGVTSIGDYAFRDCSSLTSIEIPAGVTSIGYSAFWNCSNLETIYYNGTEEQWNAIVKRSHWDSNCGNYEVVFLGDAGAEGGEG